MPLRQPTTPAALTDKPAGAVSQTCSRANTFAGTGVITSGVLTLASIPLYAGDVVTSITYISGTTAMAGGTHLWAALFDPSRALLGQSVDDAAPTWAASTSKTFTLASPVMVASTGWHYVGLMGVATTMQTMLNVNPGNIAGLIASPRQGTSTSGLTTTAPNPAAALGTGATLFYAYVS